MIIINYNTHFQTSYTTYNVFYFPRIGTYQKNTLLTHNLFVYCPNLPEKEFFSQSNFDKLRSCSFNSAFRSIVTENYAFRNYSLYYYYARRCLQMLHIKGNL